MFGFESVGEVSGIAGDVDKGLDGKLPFRLTFGGCGKEPMLIVLRSVLA